LPVDWHHLKQRLIPKEIGRYVCALLYEHCRKETCDGPRFSWVRDVCPVLKRDEAIRRQSIKFSSSS
jgi:hypothetical protein